MHIRPFIAAAALLGLCACGKPAAAERVYDLTTGDYTPALAVSDTGSPLDMMVGPQENRPSIAQAKAPETL